MTIHFSVADAKESLLSSYCGQYVPHEFADTVAEWMYANDKSAGEAVDHFNF